MIYEKSKNPGPSLKKLVCLELPPMGFSGWGEREGSFFNILKVWFIKTWNKNDEQTNM